MLFFTIQKLEKLLPELRGAIHREVYSIKRFRTAEGSHPGAELPHFDDSAWQDFTTGDAWGGYDITAWFRTSIEVPEHLMASKVVLRFLVGPRDGGNSTAEALLYVNGSPLQGIDVWHEEAWIPPELLASGRLDIALHAWSGVLGVPERRRLKLAQLVWIDEQTEHYYYMASTLLKSIQTMPESDLRRDTLLQALNHSINLLDFVEPASERFYASVSKAEAYLSSRVMDWEQLDELKPRVVGIGHAHIDMAWLWRLSHSRQKAARTFCTALHLMRQFPEYRFLHSSPQLYKFLSEDHPEIFERVRQRIASGEWEITGGMWVESDVNIPGGESLVRQFLLGIRYIRDTFGVETRVVWLPDVFGYSWSLPQIIKKSGMSYFMTTKISWSQFNRFPYDTFYWRGIDGTELLTHFVTTPETDSSFYTYNGTLSPAEIQGIWENYRQKAVNQELLSIFGWGDGGGGPTQEMLEAARLQRNLPGMPRVELGKVEPYFARLEARLEGQSIPVWDGELYLEYHRGTYTSQAQVKRANRAAEVLYHAAEWFSSLSSILTSPREYPHRRLREGWELILLNQFHDILPGSSIREVYEDAARDYDTIAGIGEEILDEALDSIVKNIRASEDGWILFNPLGWRRDGLVSLELPEGLTDVALAHAGSAANCQRIEKDGALHLLVPVRQLPAMGYRYHNPDDPPPATPGQLRITPTSIENDYYYISLNERGQLKSIFDRRVQREVLAPGRRGNIFQAFEDKPMAFDAWDIDLYYQEKMTEIDTLVRLSVEESGPLRGVLRLVWRFHDSTISQWLTVYRDSPRIDFRTEIDWQEQQVLLKVAFPVNVRSTRATYDIQFGAIERPTHWNTSWDYARFESVGHKWVDLSEGNYGVSLLNDSKYGHDIKDNVIRLTLLKSAIRPDPLADKGLHRFTYSLLPHEGNWNNGRVVQQAYELNYPILARRSLANPSGHLSQELELVQVDNHAVIIETLKRSEDDDAWIIRLYEWQQARYERVSIRFSHPVLWAVECNLIEEQEQPVTFQGNTLLFPIAPYEIKTFKFTLRSS